MMVSTIELGGVNFDVHWSYTPAEPQTYDHPGYAEELEITDIYLSDTEEEWITYFNEDTLAYIEEKIKSGE